MRLLLLAEGSVGLRITKYLLQHFPADLIAVATVGINEIYQAVDGCGIPVWVVDTEQEFISKIPRNIDLGILAWWPKVILRPLLQVPRWGFINTHPSFLPFNRGKHYNFWALVEQAPFGVSLHRVTPAVDAGEIVAQRSIPYSWSDTGGTLYTKAQDEMVSLFSETYPSLRKGDFVSVPQD